MPPSHADPSAVAARMAIPWPVHEAADRLFDGVAAQRVRHHVIVVQQRLEVLRPVVDHFVRAETRSFNACHEVSPTIGTEGRLHEIEPRRFQRGDAFRHRQEHDQLVDA